MPWRSSLGACACACVYVCVCVCVCPYACVRSCVCVCVLGVSLSGYSTADPPSIAKKQCMWCSRFLRLPNPHLTSHGKVSETSSSRVCVCVCVCVHVCLYSARVFSQRLECVCVCVCSRQARSFEHCSPCFHPLPLDLHAMFPLGAAGRHRAPLLGQTPKNSKGGQVRYAAIMSLLRQTSCKSSPVTNRSQADRVFRIWGPNPEITGRLAKNLCPDTLQTHLL